MGNHITKDVVGEKMTVRGRAARWWDDEIKSKIESRRVYRKMVRGQLELWEYYVRLRIEVKQLVLEKKLGIWNEV